MKKNYFLAMLIMGCSIVKAQVVLTVNAPSANAGVYTPHTWAGGQDAAGWGVADLTIPSNSVTGILLLAEDGSADNTGCNTLTNASAMAGKIAVINRGLCGFADKAINAQNAGAIGIIIVNNSSQYGGFTGAIGPGVSVTEPGRVAP